MDYEAMAEAGSMLGSASFIILDETVDAVWAAEKNVKFFEHESCGKCYPCQLGTQRQSEILDRILETTLRDAESGWWVPAPYMSGKLETEFSQPEEGRDFHHLELTGTLGLRFPILPELEAKVAAGARREVLDDLRELMEERDVSHLVVGYPWNMDGTKGGRAREVDELVELADGRL